MPTRILCCAACIGLLGCGARPVKPQASGTSKPEQLVAKPSELPGLPKAPEDPNTPTAQEPSETIEDARESDAEPIQATETSAAESVDVAKDESANEVDATVTNEVNNTVEASLPPAERILLLSSIGPLIIDLHITVEGIPYSETFDRLVDHVMELGDEDQDGQVTWQEVMGHRRFRYGQFGNPATTTYENQKEMERLYDTTKNGRVDRDEVVRYLTSNQGTANAMTLTTSNSNRETNREHSPVREWLDRDGDYILESNEIAMAASRLRLRDANDDEILLPGDFSNTSMQQPGMMANSSRRSANPDSPEAGWHLREKTKWADLRFGMKVRYSFGGDIVADDFLWSKELFGKLDIDIDNHISLSEMEMLLEVEPHLAVSVEIAPKGEYTPKISLTSMRINNDAIESIVQHQPNRLTMTIGETTLDFYAADQLGQGNFEERAKNMLAQADADKNEYVSEDEFAAIAPQLNNLAWEAVDLNEDDMLINEEIITLLEQQNAAQRGKVRVIADDNADALLPSLDVNHDGRIDSREIAQVDQSLLRLDKNGDERIELDELHDGMVIGVVRGGFRGDNAFQIPATQPNRSEDSPRWFTGMDRNSDGGISWREFLGTRSQFDELDRDDDGFVTREEARGTRDEGN